MGGAMKITKHWNRGEKEERKRKGRKELKNKIWDQGINEKKNGMTWTCYCRVLYTCGIIPCSLFIAAGSRWMYQDSITHLLYHSVFTSRTSTSSQSTLWSSFQACSAIAEVSMFPCSTAHLCSFILTATHTPVGNLCKALCILSRSADGSVLNLLVWRASV